MANGLPVGVIQGQASFPFRAAQFVDQISKHPTLFSRFMRKGKPWRRTSMQFPIYMGTDIDGNGARAKFTWTPTTQTALDNSQNVSSQNITTAMFDYGLTFGNLPFTHNVIESIMNQEGEIKFDDFIRDAAYSEALQSLGGALYSPQSANQFYTLDEIISNTGVLAGVDRATYPAINSNVVTSVGALTYKALRDMFTTVSDNGAREEVKEIWGDEVTWGYVGDLMTPTLRQNFEASRTRMPVNDDKLTSEDALKISNGFKAIAFMGIPVMADKFATAGSLYFLNPDYLGWYGVTKVPAEFKGSWETVKLGTPTTIEGQAQRPTDNHGFMLYEPKDMNDDGVNRTRQLALAGQFICTQPRRQGRMSGINGTV